MVRTFVCAVVALLMVAGLGLAQDKGGKGKKGTTVQGEIKKIDAATGTLTITVKKKGETEGKDMTFTIAADTKVNVFTPDSEKPTTLTGKDGLKDPQFKVGVKVGVTTDPNDPSKVLAVRVGTGKKKEKK